MNSLENFDNMTISQLRDLQLSYLKIASENKYIKAKYPKAKEELEAIDIEELIQNA